MNEMNKPLSPIDSYLNSQELHELCMDYRAASPALAHDCYIRLQDSIRINFESQLADSKKWRSVMTAIADDAQKRSERAAESADFFEQKVKMLQDALLKISQIDLDARGAKTAIRHISSTALKEPK